MGDDAIKDAAGKAANEAKELAKDAAAVGKLVASSGADLSAWWRLIKRWIGRLIKLMVAVGLIFIQMLAAATTANAEMNCDTGVPGVSASTDVKVNDWDAKQMNFAATIIQTGVNLKVPPRGIIIALATAMQESTLHNYGDLGDRNDHDSQGLFQQRPSSGWGTPAQVRDPVHAATSFYKKLLKVDGWESMPLTRAAQKVQVSAYPNAYAKWESNATQVYQKITNSPNYAGGVNAPPVDQAAADAACNVDAAATDGGKGGPAPKSFDELGNPRKVEEAIAWAIAFSKSGATHFPSGREISGMCDHSTAQAYGWPASGENTAQIHWDDIPAKLKHPGTSAPPRGALVFWNTASDANHVALSLGDGTVMTTDSPKGKYGQATLKKIDGWGPRIGWAAPAFPNMSSKV